MHILSYLYNVARICVGGESDEDPSWEQGRWLIAAWYESVSKVGILSTVLLILGSSSEPSMNSRLHQHHIFDSKPSG